MRRPTSKRVSIVRAAGVGGLLFVAALLLGACSGDGSLSGGVRDGAGRPAAGLLVSVYRTNDATRVATATTDANGHYSFPALAPNAYRVVARDPRGVYRESWFASATTFASATDVRFGAGQAGVADLTVTAAGPAVQGTVTDRAAGTPLAATVEVLKADDGSVARTLTTGSDGRYAATGLAPTRYKLRFSAPGRATVYWPSGHTLSTASIVDLTAGGAATADQTLSIPGGIAGSVADARGWLRNVLAIVTVPGTTDVVTYATTNIYGYFDIAGLDPGTYDVGFWDPAFDVVTHAGHYPKLYHVAVPDLANATPVTVIAGQSTRGIDDLMAGIDCDPFVYAPGADLHGRNLSGLKLSGCDLHGANLNGADLSGADLYGADLSNADLRGANLTGAETVQVKLDGALLPAVTFTVDRPAAPAGTQVIVSGTGWIGDGVSIYFGAYGGCYIYPGGGSFSGPCTVPLRPGGPVTVTATGTTTGRSSSAEFAVQPRVTVNTADVSAGHWIRFYAAGFAARATLTFSMDGRWITNGPTWAGTWDDGNTQLDYTVPTTLAAGTHTMSVSDRFGNQSSITFNVFHPTIAVSPTTGTPGSPITITGAGWRPGSTIYNSVSTCLLLADSNGDLHPVSACSVFQLPYGPVTVTAGDGAAYGVQIDTTGGQFAVTQSGRLDDDAVAPGSTIRVSAAGLSSNSTVAITVDGTAASFPYPFAGRVDYDGAFNNVPVKLPADLPVGRHEVRITDAGGHSVVLPFGVYTPSIDLQPTSASPGSPVTVTGSGWAPGSTVLGFPCDLVADGSGVIAPRTCPLGDLPAGARQIVLQDRDHLALNASAPVTVVPVVTTSGSIIRGGQSQASARGFAANSRLIVRLDDVDLGTFYASYGDGSYPYLRLYIPQDIPGGNHQLIVTDSAGNTASTTVFVFAPTLAFTPTSGPKGTIVSFSGTGWPPGMFVRLSIGYFNVCVSTTTTSSGEIPTVTCPVSTVSVAPYQVTVQALDGGSVIVPDAIFTVTPSGP